MPGPKSSDAGEPDASCPPSSPCTSSNASHGRRSRVVLQPALQSSDFLTVGTPDANGKPAASSGFMQLKIIGESPINPSNGDQGDVGITMSFTDVRKQSDLSDYTGELQALLTLRITDRYNGDLLEDPATTSDTPFAVTVPCAATTGPEGGTCSISTTADAVMARRRQGRRAVGLGIGTGADLDGGSDGDADTTGDNTLFAVQGAFAP